MLLRSTELTDKLLLVKKYLHYQNVKLSLLHFCLWLQQNRCNMLINELSRYWYARF